MLSKRESAVSLPPTPLSPVHPHIRSRTGSGEFRNEYFLHLNVVEGKEIKTTDADGKNDAFCVVKIDGQDVGRTDIIWNSKTPEWNHDFMFGDLPVTFETLDLVIWDANVFSSHKPIGTVTLSKETLRASRKESEWFSLTPASPDEAWVSGSICLRTKAETDGSMAKLTITVEGGRDLPSKDTNGFSDPYVALSLLPQSHASVQKTQVKKKTLNPVYNETFVFTMPRHEVPGGKLLVSVWDWDNISKDDFMGYFVADLENLFQLGDCTRDYFLRSRSHALIQNLAGLSKKDFEDGPKDLRESRMFCRAAQETEMPLVSSISAMLPPPSPTKMGSSKSFRTSMSQIPLDSVGTIRLKIKFLDERVYPLERYSKIMKLVSKDNFALATLLGRHSSEREATAKALIMYYASQGEATEFIKGVVKAEVDSTLQASTIFRGNSIASKAIDVYMKILGKDYLEETLKKVIDSIIESKKKRAFELDPTRLTNVKEKERDENLQMIKSFSQDAIKSILSSAANCPAQLRDVFNAVRDAVIEKFGDDQVTPFTSVAGFIFLRFFCPALLGPKLFGLTNLALPAYTTRNLTLVAKVVQNLANLMPFGAKEPYMTGLNDVINQNMIGVKNFLCYICTKPAFAMECVQLSDIDAAREANRVAYYVGLLVNDREKWKLMDAKEVALIQEAEYLLKGI